MKTILSLIFFFPLVVAGQQPFGLVRKHLDHSEYKRVNSLLDSCAVKGFHSDSVLYYQSIAFLKQQKLKYARKSIRKLEKNYPMFSDAEYLRALLSFSEENYGKCIDQFTAVLRKDSLHLKALYNRALAFGMINEFGAAIKDLNALTLISPANPEVFYSRAYWHEYTGNFSEAVKDYESSIKLDPRNYDAYIGLAYIYHSQNDSGRACEVITRAIGAGSQLAGELRDYYCR
jgi:tetratricopeptide (TPR) repeat protein